MNFQEFEEKIRQLDMPSFVFSYRVTISKNELNERLRQWKPQIYSGDTHPLQVSTPAMTLDEMMEAVNSLPPLDPTPLRANQWTIDEIRRVFAAAPSNEAASNELGFAVPFGAVEVHLDESLEDGIVMQGDKVLCSVKKGEE